MRAGAQLVRQLVSCGAPADSVESLARPSRSSRGAPLEGGVDFVASQAGEGVVDVAVVGLVHPDGQDEVPHRRGRPAPKTPPARKQRQAELSCGIPSSTHPSSKPHPTTGMGQKEGSGHTLQVPVADADFRCRRGIPLLERACGRTVGGIMRVGKEWRQATPRR
jgi:hypothetical protein